MKRYLKTILGYQAIPAKHYFCSKAVQNYNIFDVRELNEASDIKQYIHIFKNDLKEEIKYFNTLIMN
ncbi:MAG TPA: hypothetical protein DCY71_01685 [Clostridiaceae bacterium]|jgi:hypothetical protein|nr:hypothetical protein [Clostridiaceae bacterium]